MSDPLTALALGLNAAGTLARGNARVQQARFQAALMQREADRAREEAVARAAVRRRQTSRDRAYMRARYAASGIDPSSGSPLLALETMTGDAELEALSIARQGEASAARFEGRAQGSLLRGRGARRTALLAAGTRVLEGLI